MPANRPERIEKATASGADAVCFDLEDSIPESAKATARGALAGTIETWSGTGVPVGIRINDLRGPHGVRDLAALLDCARPAFLMLPKTNAAAEIEIAAGSLPGVPLWPIIETVAGLRACDAIANAPGVAGLLFGGADLSSELGAALEWAALLHARSELVLAARGRIELIDVPEIDVTADSRLTRETAMVRSMGFTGRACIHPRQVAIVNEAFAPSPDEVAHARSVVETFAASKGSAALLNGRLVERPLLRAAEATLLRAGMGGGV